MCAVHYVQYYFPEFLYMSQLERPKCIYDQYAPNHFLAYDRTFVDKLNRAVEEAPAKRTCPRESKSIRSKQVSNL